MRVELEHVLPHPVDRVFAVMSDPSRRPEWQENTKRVEMLTPAPSGLGTRWRETQGGIGEVEAEVVGYEQNALWSEAGTSGAGTGRITVTFRPDGDGATHVGMDVELNLRGLRRAMEPALAPMVRKRMPADLARLEELLRREA